MVATRLHEPVTISNEIPKESYYVVILLLDACEKKGLHQGMPYGGCDLRLCSLSFPMLLILSHYKTRGRVFYKPRENVAEQERTYIKI